MIGQTEALLHQLIEERMAKKPTPVRKGIPIGSYEEIADKAGKIRLKKKPYRMTHAEQCRKHWHAEGARKVALRTIGEGGEAA